MEVHADDLDPERARLRDHGERGVGGEPELRLVVRGLDRLVRDRLDAGRQPDERALHTGRGGAPGLVRRVEHDGRARLGRAAELVLRLVVAVEENPLAVDARGLRDGELAERRDVGADALLGEDPAAARRSGTPSSRTRRVHPARRRGTRAPARGSSPRSRRRAASRARPRAATRTRRRASARRSRHRPNVGIAPAPWDC